MAGTLREVFPEVRFDESKFVSKPGIFCLLSVCRIILMDGLANYWQDLQNRRIFLENYARTNNFDPLISENWYSLTREKLLRSEVRLLIHFLWIVYLRVRRVQMHC